MKTFTNINIKSPNHTFQYLAEYNNEVIQKDVIYKYTDNDDIYITKDTQYIRVGNEWVSNELYNYKDISISKFDTSIINIYFPDYSIDIYDKTNYMVIINTWVCGRPIYLYSNVINRIDCLASDKYIRRNSNNYYEYIPISIINPYSIAYSDNWKEFRNTVCGEVIKEDGSSYNNTDSQLCVTLIPVTKYNESYIMLNEYNCGYGCFDIEEETSKCKLSLTPQFDNGFSLKAELKFNNYYEDIYEYIKETYNIEKCEIRYEIVTNFIGDNVIVSKESDSNICIFDKNDLKQLSVFDKWPESLEGIVLTSSINISHSGNDIYFMSNSVPVTQDIFKYVVLNSETQYINLNELDMNIYNITPVNKKITEVIKLDNVTDSKSYAIQPVFVRVKDSQILMIHKNVIENICVNLDQYKSYVDHFILKIGNHSFKQIGSNSQGIVFKINGLLLNKIDTDGIYYILNQDYELVTTGKYTCK